MSTPIYMSLTDVAARVSLSEATVQKMVREDSFPKPRLLSANRVGWLYREVVEWAEARPVSNLPPPPNTGARKGKRLTPATALATAGQVA